LAIKHAQGSVRAEGGELRAILLCGGYGEGLRPLTNSRPKALIPLVGRNIVEWTMDSLPQEVEEVILSVGPFGDMFFQEFENYVEKDVLIVREEYPLGTAGAVRNSTKLLKDGTFMVLSGDLICEMDLSKLLDFHWSNEFSITAALSIEGKDTFKFKLDEDGRISEISEANGFFPVGAFVFEPEVLDILPRIGSLESDVFPILIRTGELGGLLLSGKYIRIKGLNDYLEAQEHLLNSMGLESLIEKDVSIGKDVEITGSYIAEGCEISSNTSIEKSALLGFCKIGEESSISKSIIGEGSVLPPGSRVFNRIIREESRA